MNTPKSNPAPYGFVPLNEHVVEADWAHDKMHDIPFADGISGSFEIEITAETPILVSGPGEKDDGIKRPFKLPDGTYALPGSAVRGWLRNTVEIASFGRMQLVNDHRYAVRDLHAKEMYQRHMAELRENPSTGKNEPMPLVNAGWLRPATDSDATDAPYVIDVCHFAKIHYRHLEKMARARGARHFDPATKQSAVKKYRTWLRDAKLDVSVSVEEARGVELEKGLLSRFGKVSRSGHWNVDGTLVFTGQPQNYKGKNDRRSKQNDFVFFGSAGHTLPVTKEVFADFEFGHSARGQQYNLGRSTQPNEEWAYQKRRLEAEGRAPVFFLMNRDGGVRAFGLAMMFRLAYKTSVREGVENAQGTLDVLGHDMAEAIFGRVRDGDQKMAPALKGRVRIGHARASGSPRTLKPVAAILNQPSASYYPNYVEQDPDHPGAAARTSSRQARDGRPLTDIHYKTWMDDDARPRGYKRYRPMTKPAKPYFPTESKGKQSAEDAKVVTRFAPLEAGATFKARIDVHNLRPAELGALLWSLDLGGDENARHTIGYARPLGYGTSRVRLVPESLRLRSLAGEAVEPTAAVASFCRLMTDKLGADFEDTVQIVELRALSHPVDPSEVPYQRLDPGRRINEFTDAKRVGATLGRAGRGGRVLRKARTTATSTRIGGRRGGGGGRPAAPARPKPAPRPKVEGADLVKFATMRVTKQNAANEVPELVAKYGDGEHADVLVNE